MARQVYFSFHYQRDIWRVNVVRHAPRAQPEVGFFDHSLWEATKRTGAPAVQRLISEGMRGAGVTAVLIGWQTAGRRWVNYEIQKSLDEGKGLLGIHINGIRDRFGRSDPRGASPFAAFTVRRGFARYRLDQVVPTYDWVNDRGFTNIGVWIDKAAAAAGR